MKQRGPQVNTPSRYNRPLSDDIAVLMPNDATSNIYVALHYRDGGLLHNYIRIA